MCIHTYIYIHTHTKQRSTNIWLRFDMNRQINIDKIYIDKNGDANIKYKEIWSWWNR